MLKSLQKFFKQEGVSVEMTTEIVEANQAEVPNVEAIAAELAELKSSFAQVSETLAQTTEKLQAAEAALAAVEKEKADAVAEAAKEKTNARLTKLQEVVGDAKAVELLTAFEGLDDKVFEAMVGTLSANMATEAKSEQFVEQGVDAVVETPAEADMVTRLAAKLEAEYAPKNAK
jgi:chromosome segregation ATPase